MTKTVKVKNRSGNFAWDVEIELTPEQEAACIEAGVVQILQRSPVSAWEKAIAYPGAKAKRPEGFKRDSIEFTTENATALALALEGAKITIGEKEEPLVLTANVTEYVATTAEPKYAAETKKYLEKAGNMEKLAALALAVGYGGELGDGKTAPTAFLQQIKAYLTERMKAI